MWDCVHIRVCVFVFVARGVLCVVRGGGEGGERRRGAGVGGRGLGGAPWALPTKETSVRLFAASGV